MKKLSSDKIQKLVPAILLLLFILVIPVLLYGQPGLPDDPPQTPIDGGLSILAALGGGYAIKKLRDKNKE